MGRGDHKHKSNRKKLERAQMPELAPVKPRAKQGKARMQEIERDRERYALSEIPALQTRARLQGLADADRKRVAAELAIERAKAADDRTAQKDATKLKMDAEREVADLLRDARSPWWGCEAGKAMAAAVEAHTERLALWDAIQHMRRVVTSYDRAIGAPNRHATCMRLLVPTDPLTATAETPPLDERTDEEKQRQAVSGLMALEGALGWTDKAAASEAKRVVLDDWTARDVDGLLSALRCVSDLVKGNVMRYRGRDIAC